MVLFLNDIGTWEVLLILVFILIFFGSKSIPGLARTMGRTMRQIKDASNEIQSEIRKSGDGIRKDLNLKGMLEETAEDIRRPLDQQAQEIEQAMKHKPLHSTPKGFQAKVEKTVDSQMKKSKETTSESTPVNEPSKKETPTKPASSDDQSDNLG